MEYYEVKGNYLSAMTYELHLKMLIYLLRLTDSRIAFDIQRFLLYTFNKHVIFIYKYNDKCDFSTDIKRKTKEIST